MAWERRLETERAEIEISRVFLSLWLSPDRLFFDSDCGCDREIESGNCRSGPWVAGGFESRPVEIF